MLFLGRFWGIVCIFMIIGSILLFLVRCFYKTSVSGLSKGSHRKLIETTIYWINILEECHVVFGIGALIAALFHSIIMKFFVEESILGVIVLILFVFTFVMGVVEKYVYRDSKGVIKKYHFIIDLVFILFLILHVLF